MLIVVVVIIKLLGVSGTENCVSLGQDHLTSASYAYLPANGNSFA